MKSRDLNALDIKMLSFISLEWKKLFKKRFAAHSCGFREWSGWKCQSVLLLRSCFAEVCWKQTCCFSVNITSQIKDSTWSFKNAKKYFVISSFCTYYVSQKWFCFLQFLHFTKYSMLMNAVLVTSIAIGPDTTGWLLQTYLAMDCASLVAGLPAIPEKEWQ